MRNSIVLVIFLAVPFDAVTVSTLCPTNKIAPHRKIGSWQRSNTRTIGAFYDLLTPNRPQVNFQDGLQEQPQEDELDDCGEIEDYDENDLSSIAQPTRNRHEREDNRFFFGGTLHRPQNPGHRPTRPPPTTPRPITRPPRPPHPNYPKPPNRPPQGAQPPYYPPQGPQQPNYPPQRPPQPSFPPQRPPYWSGGVFSNNQYQQPTYQNPSDNYKPVHETADFSDIPQIYRPGVVGGSLGHVVGVTQARPTTPSPDNRRGADYFNVRPHSTQATLYSTRRPRTGKLGNNNSVIGSFIDLLF